MNFLTQGKCNENDTISNLENQEIDRYNNTELDACLEIFDFSKPLPPKGNDTLRVFYNNCNGIEINNTMQVHLKQKKDKLKHKYLIDVEAPTKLDSLIRQMKVWEVDLANFSELCIAWEKQAPRYIVQQITKHYDRTGCWTVATSQVDTGGFLKPGGAGILALGQSNGKIIDRGVDPWKMGRWAYKLIAGSSTGHQLLVISGYRTGPRSDVPGFKTAWVQQQTMLLKEKRVEKPHMAFFVDLSSWLRKYLKPNMEVLLCFDANELWGERKEVTKFATNMDLRCLNKEFDLPATHPNIANSSRSTTIDFCLCSPRVLQYVKYAASAPFDLDTLGDHRGFVIDINWDLLLPQDTPKKDIQARKLVMSSPKAVEKYLQAVEAKFTCQNIHSRCKKLLKRVETGHTDLANIMKKYEALDREVFGICQKAEKKCKAAWAGTYEWSPKLVQAIKQLQYWRTRLTTPTETLRVTKLGTELGIKYIPLNKDVIQDIVTQCRQQLSDIQNDARQHRQDHLDMVAQNYADQNSMSKQQAILELIAHEDARSTFRVLKQRLKTNNQTQVSTLWISRNENGNFNKDMDRKLVYTNKDDINKAILQRNKSHLGQASVTPFAQGQLRKELKWDGTGPLGEKMLNGTILYERRFAASMQLYLESLRVNDMSRLGVIKPSLSLEEYHLFWKKKRETTVTSPFGLHVGHYKAALHKLAILDVHRILLLIPFKTGMVPSRWRKTVQTMLEKEPGSPWIHRMRIIELFDAQANAGFQIFVGRNMMRHAVQNKLLNDESFGSTPGKTATSALVQKLIAVDQLRIERRAGGIFDCDASGCYDRILPPLASVHLQALGLQQSIGTVLARLMFQAKRHVKTSFGVSTTGIRTTKKHVLHGIGQGNGGGPAMWISHLTVMFAAISSVCIGFAMTCVQKISQVTTVGTGYVDDVTLGLSVTRERPQTETKVRTLLQRMGQIWEQLLYITGGRLELSKCFWIPITWKWKRGVPILVQKSRSGKEMKLQESESHDLIIIPRLLGKEPVKRLGVTSTCDGKWNREVQQWLSFSREFSTKVRNGYLNRAAGYLAYKAVWIAKFRYSASVIGYSTNQLQEIQQSIVSSCLSAAGYSNKLPRAVVFGPAKYGGMEWENITVLTVYEKLKTLIGSIRLQDKLGQMILIKLDWLHLFAGVSTPLLTRRTIIPYLPRGWLVGIHHLLVDTDIQVEIGDRWLPTPQRKDDRVLMDIAHHSAPDWAWEGINRCRLFLQATTVADITTEEGTYIPKKIRQVKGHLRRSNLLFPVQLRPKKDDIEQWQYLIDLISANGQVFQPLGHWIRHPDQQFPFLMNADRTIVYKRTDKHWQLFGRQTRGSRRYVKMTMVVNTIPLDSLPVTVIESTRYLIVMGKGQENDRMEISSSVSISQRQRMVEYVMGIFEINLSLIDELKAVWHEEDTTIVCATDGGLKDQVGTSSYAFFFPDNPCAILFGKAGEYQPHTHASSTRQELLGQLGAEYWLGKLASEWGVPRRHIQIMLVTDSQASIEIMENTQQSIGLKSVLSSDMDIALELKAQRVENYWVNRTVQKVESHIEEEDAPDGFLWGCNYFVDELATKAWNDYTVENLRHRDSHILQGTRAACKINGRVENNMLYDVLKAKILGGKLKRYLMDRYSWNDTVFHQIDWSTHHSEYKKYPSGRRITLTKYLHGWLATTKRRFREGRSINMACKLCGLEENRLHVFRCANEQFSQIRKQKWEVYIQEVGKKTDSCFKTVFHEGLRTALGHAQPVQEAQNGWPENIREAYETQHQIGWEQVFFGRIARQWEQLAEYNQVGGAGIRQTQWTARAIRLSWQFGLELWMLRNQLVHGSTQGISRVEIDRVHTLIKGLYAELPVLVPPHSPVAFTSSETTLLQTGYHNQVAWLGHMKHLYPQEFKIIEKQVASQMMTSTQEAQVHLTTLVGGLN